MGSAAADLPVEVGASAILDIALGVTKDDNGEFLDIRVPEWKNNGDPNNYAGGVLPWQPSTLPSA